MQFSVKYRPKSFGEFVGHEFLILAIKNSIYLNKVPNALIFCGPKGIGKTSLARVFAKALNCPNFITSKDVCNNCSNCNSIQNSSALDYIEIDAASYRGIEDVKKIENIISLKNFSLPYKVIVLDEAHMITQEGWNALLKTIEEPPPNIKIIFATTDAEKLPPTILSRCQKFEFTPLPKKYIVENLKNICIKENIPYNVSVLEKIAEYSGGSLRDAQILLEQIFIADNSVEKISTIFALLGTCLPEEIAELFDYIIEQNPSKVFTWIDQKLPKIYNYNVFAQELLNYVDKLITQKFIDKPITGSDVYQFKIKSQVDKLSIEKLLLISRILLQLKSQLYFFDNPTLLFTTFLLKLSMIDSLSLLNLSDLKGESNDTSENVVSREKGNNQEIIQENKQPLPPAKATQEEKPIQTYNEDIWQGILAEIKSRHVLTYNMLKNVKLLDISDTYLKLGYTNANNEKYYFQKEKTLEIIKNAVQKKTGKRVEVIFEMMDDDLFNQIMQNKSFSKFFSVFKGKVTFQ